MIACHFVVAACFCLYKQLSVKCKPVVTVCKHENIIDHMG